MSKIVSLLIIIWSLLSCIKVEDINSIPKYSVYCILSPSNSKIELFLANTYELNKEVPIDSGKYIKNAIVKIKSNSGSLSLKLNPKTKNYEADNNNFLTDNKEYELQIIVNNDTINGKTKIPLKPILILDEARVVDNEAQISVSWKNVNNEKAYYRLTANVETGLASNPLFYWGNEFGIWRTTSELNASNLYKSPNGNFQFGQNLKEVEINISLESLDSAWFDFKSKLEALLIRDSFTKKFEAPINYPITLKNAVGVFGSSTSSELKIQLKNN